MRLPRTQSPSVLAFRGGVANAAAHLFPGPQRDAPLQPSRQEPPAAYGGPRETLLESRRSRAPPADPQELADTRSVFMLSAAATGRPRETFRGQRQGGHPAPIRHASAAGFGAPARPQGAGLPGPQPSAAPNVPAAPHLPGGPDFQPMRVSSAAQLRPGLDSSRHEAEMNASQLSQTRNQSFTRERVRAVTPDRRYTLALASAASRAAPVRREPPRRPTLEESLIASQGATLPGTRRAQQAVRAALGVSMGPEAEAARAAQERARSLQALRAGMAVSRFTTQSSQVPGARIGSAANALGAPVAGGVAAGAPDLRSLTGGDDAFQASVSRMGASGIQNVAADPFTSFNARGQPFRTGPRPGLHTQPAAGVLPEFGGYGRSDPAGTQARGAPSGQDPAAKQYIAAEQLASIHPAVPISGHPGPVGPYRAGRSTSRGRPFQRSPSLLRPSLEHLPYEEQVSFDLIESTRGPLTAHERSALHRSAVDGSLAEQLNRAVDDTMSHPTASPLGCSQIAARRVASVLRAFGPGDDGQIGFPSPGPAAPARSFRYSGVVGAPPPQDSYWPEGAVEEPVDESHGPFRGYPQDSPAGRVEERLGGASGGAQAEQRRGPLEELTRGLFDTPARDTPASRPENPSREPQTGAQPDSQPEFQPGFQDRLYEGHPTAAEPSSQYATHRPRSARRNEPAAFGSLRGIAPPPRDGDTSIPGIAGMFAPPRSSPGGPGSRALQEAAGRTPERAGIQQASRGTPEPSGPGARIRAGMGASPSPAPTRPAVSVTPFSPGDDPDVMELLDHQDQAAARARRERSSRDSRPDLQAPDYGAERSSNRSGDRSGDRSGSADQSLRLIEDQGKKIQHLERDLDDHKAHTRQELDTLSEKVRESFQTAGAIRTISERLQSVEGQLQSEGPSSRGPRPDRRESGGRRSGWDVGEPAGQGQRGPQNPSFFGEGQGVSGLIDTEDTQRPEGQISGAGGTSGATLGAVPEGERADAPRGVSEDAPEGTRGGSPKGVSGDTPYDRARGTSAGSPSRQPRPGLHDGQRETPSRSPAALAGPGAAAAAVGGAGALNRPEAGGDGGDSRNGDGQGSFSVPPEPPRGATPGSSHQPGLSAFAGGAAAKPLAFPSPAPADTTRDSSIRLRGHNSEPSDSLRGRPGANRARRGDDRDDRTNKNRSNPDGDSDSSALFGQPGAGGAVGGAGATISADGMRGVAGVSGAVGTDGMQLPPPVHKAGGPSSFAPGYAQDDRGGQDDPPADPQAEVSESSTGSTDAADTARLAGSAASAASLGHRGGAGVHELRASRSRKHRKRRSRSGSRPARDRAASAVQPAGGLSGLAGRTGVAGLAGLAGLGGSAAAPGARASDAAAAAAAPSRPRNPFLDERRLQGVADVAVTHTIAEGVKSGSLPPGPGWMMCGFPLPFDHSHGDPEDCPPKHDELYGIFPLVTRPQALEALRQEILAANLRSASCFALMGYVKHCRRWINNLSNLRVSESLDAPSAPMALSSPEFSRLLSRLISEEARGVSVSSFLSRSRGARPQPFYVRPIFDSGLLSSSSMDIEQSPPAVCMAYNTYSKLYSATITDPDSDVQSFRDLQSHALAIASPDASIRIFALSTLPARPLGGAPGMGMAGSVGVAGTAGSVASRPSFGSLDPSASGPEGGASHVVSRPAMLCIPPFGLVGPPEGSEPFLSCGQVCQRILELHENDDFTPIPSAMDFFANLLVVGHQNGVLVVYDCDNKDGGDTLLQSGMEASLIGGAAGAAGAAGSADASADASAEAGAEPNAEAGAPGESSAFHGGGLVRSMAGRGRSLLAQPFSLRGRIPRPERALDMPSVISMFSPFVTGPVNSCLLYPQAHNGVPAEELGVNSIRVLCAGRSKIISLQLPVGTSSLVVENPGASYSNMIFEPSTSLLWATEMTQKGTSVICVDLDSGKLKSSTLVCGPELTVDCLAAADPSSMLIINCLDELRREARRTGGKSGYSSHHILAVAFSDGVIRLYDSLQELRLVHKIEATPRLRFPQLRICGRHLIAGDSIGRVAIWDIFSPGAGCQNLGLFEGNACSGLAVDVGRIVACSQDGRAVALDFHL